MRQSEYRKKLKDASEAELANMLQQERKSIYDLRQRLALKQLDNPHAISNAKRNVARILGEMRERELQAGRGS